MATLESSRSVRGSSEDAPLTRRFRWGVLGCGLGIGLTFVLAFGSVGEAARESELEVADSELRLQEQEIIERLNTANSDRPEDGMEDVYHSLVSEEGASAPSEKSEKLSTGKNSAASKSTSKVVPISARKVDPKAVSAARSVNDEVPLNVPVRRGTFAHGSIREKDLTADAKETQTVVSQNDESLTRTASASSTSKSKAPAKKSSPEPEDLNDLAVTPGAVKEIAIKRHYDGRTYEVDEPTVVKVEIEPEPVQVAQVPPTQSAQDQSVQGQSVQAIMQVAPVVIEETTVVDQNRSALNQSLQTLDQRLKRLEGQLGDQHGAFGDLLSERDQLRKQLEAEIARNRGLSEDLQVRKVQVNTLETQIDRLVKMVDTTVHYPAPVIEIPSDVDDAALVPMPVGLPKARVASDQGELHLTYGNNSQVTRRLSHGTPVAIETRIDDWYRVVTPTGSRGWIQAREVVFSGRGSYDASGSLVRVAGYDASVEGEDF